MARCLNVATQWTGTLTAIVVGSSLVLATGASGHAQRTVSSQSPVTPAVDAAKTHVPYSEAKSILDTLRADLLPVELRGHRSAERERPWLNWVSRRDEEIRSRLREGDEDSIVNLLWFGTAFTQHPRMTATYLSTLGDDGPDALLDARLGDLAAGIRSPGVNERLQLARAMVEAAGIDLANAAGARDVDMYLAQVNTRTLQDLDRYLQVESTSPSAFFSERGLSSDTSILIDFAVDRALDEIASQGLLTPGSVRRVAVVGPGLDFFNKENGYDFYPVQTIQPFAVIDSLLRRGLAAADLRVTTFDVSARVNGHLDEAIQRARTGSQYVLHAPRDTEERWSPGLVSYWETFGDRIGEETAGVSAPPELGAIDVRVVRIRPAIVTSTLPQDLNIILERQDLVPEERFDLIIATNILLYYGTFEQSLALSNLASMLRPRGLFLSNDYVFPLPVLPMTIVGETEVSYMGGATDDIVTWYERQ